MSELKIEGTEKTPTVYFNLEEGAFSFYGNSMPETPSVFYSQILSWLNTRQPQFNGSINLQFDFDYLDSPSFGYIVEVLRVFERMEGANENVSVRWTFAADDVDTAEVGKDLLELCDIPISILERENAI